MAISKSWQVGSLPNSSFNSMIDFVSARFTNIDSVCVLSFSDTWAGVFGGPIGTSFWFYDGTTGGTPTLTTNLAIATAMASGRVITADGKGWTLAEAEYYLLSQFGGAPSTENSLALSSMLALCSARKKACCIDVSSTVTNITLPSYVDLEIRANILHSSTTTDCFIISNSNSIRIDFGYRQGFTTQRTGTRRLLYITGSSNYANQNIEVRNARPIGGVGNMVEWSACRKLWFIDFSPSDMDGVGIYNISNNSTNPYKSDTIVFEGVNCENITGSTLCHGVSINSWNFVENVFVHKCSMKGIKNNPIEIWANKGKIWENTILDGAIAISCGACHWLDIHDNDLDVTTPSVSSSTPGTYGIEIGACQYYNVHHNRLRGFRSGIIATGANINGGTNWYTTTELYSQAGTPDPANTNKLRVLSRDYVNAENAFAGAAMGIIDSNVVIDSLDVGIYAAADYSQTRSSKITNNLVVRVGRFGTPTVDLGAIACVGGKFDVSCNTVEDSLNYAIYNLLSRVALGPNTAKKIDATGPYGAAGVGASFNFLARQDFSECTISGECAGAVPTQGTYYIGDTLLNHVVAAGGSLGLMCTAQGTQSNQLNAITFSTTNGQPTATASTLGDLQIGAVITLSGGIGVKRVVDISYTSRVVTFNSNCNATIGAATVVNLPAVFKALPSIGV